ncbi:MAG: C69 family dipeptidase [Bacteroidales bacterium]|nr:C69 family dipeptidase [Bacteroidales bacterium]
MKKITLSALLLAICLSLSCQVDKSDWINGFADGCTSVTVGRLASSDGSVYTSHTDDSHRTRSNVLIEPAARHSKDETVELFKRGRCDTTTMPTYSAVKVGEIPQVKNTYGFINSAYPCMNEKQLAIGESTFGGRSELVSDNGLIDCERLCMLMLQRCASAREAIKTAGELLKEYGWIDEGECLTIADKKEVWHLEIVGPGKGNKGAVWVAQRVPDDHIAVNANASTIKEIDAKDSDHFMFSDNVFSYALEQGWWNGSETFRFCYVYAPETRTSVASRRREWRVFDLLAPSLKLDANAENFPFSVKPDKPVTLEDMIMVFKDQYEGTDYDMCKTLLVPDEDGKMTISPLANPQMPYDMTKMLRLNGGWGELGERTISRWYTMYATIIQCRNFLPDAIGGVVWLALDNVSTSVYVPVYNCVTDLPSEYKTCGRETGFSRRAAWWAFNRLGTLAVHRWGDMRHDVDAVWKPFQKEMISNQKTVEEEALRLYKSDKKTCVSYLSSYSNSKCSDAVEKAWNLGDFLWTKYDEKW